MGTGYWVLGTGYWVLGTGYWVLGFGYLVLGSGYWGIKYRVFYSFFLKQVINSQSKYDFSFSGDKCSVL